MLLTAEHTLTACIQAAGAATGGPARAGRRPPAFPAGPRRRSFRPGRRGSPLRQGSSTTTHRKKKFSAASGTCSLAQQGFVTALTLPGASANGPPGAPRPDGLRAPGSRRAEPAAPGSYSSRPAGPSAPRLLPTSLSRCASAGWFSAENS